MKKKFILKVYPGRCWSVAELEVYESDKLIETITANLFYDVSDDFVSFYETTGGSGTGFKKGKLIRRVDISNCEFNTIIN